MATHYLEKFQVLQDPAATSELCGFLADLSWPRRPANWPTSWPARRPAGSSWPSRRAASSACGRSSPRRSSAVDGRPRREFRRGFTIAPGERVVLVDDILTTGGSLLAMIPAVEALGGEIVACHVLVDRSGGMASLTSPRTGRVYPLARPVGPRPADLRAGPRDLPALRRRTAGPGSGQHGYSCLRLSP